MHITFLLHLRQSDGRVVGVRCWMMFGVGGGVCSWMAVSAGGWCGGKVFKCVRN